MPRAPLQRALHTEPPEDPPREWGREAELSGPMARVELEGARRARRLCGQPVLQARETEDMLTAREQRRVNQRAANGTGELGGVVVLAVEEYALEAHGERLRRSDEGKKRGVPGRSADF